MGILDGNNKLANNGKTTHLEYDDDKGVLHVIAAKDVRVPVDHELWSMIKNGKEYRKYPLSVLERCNFVDINDWNDGERLYSINQLRTILYTYNRINLYDRYILVLLGLTDDDLDIRTSEVIKSKKVSDTLFNYNILHLWQLLLLNEKDLLSGKKCDEASIEYIKETLSKYGYHLLHNNYYEETEQFYQRLEEKMQKDAIARRV
jgi:hypothetical protein